jgi:ABC-2 type transport system permease protein
MIAAILRAQFLSMRWGRGRGQIVRAIPQAIFYTFWLAAGVGACILAMWAPEAALRSYLPLVFLGILCYWQLMPVLTASLGRSLDLKKLAPYPVPHGKLFFVETLLCLTSTLEMSLVIAGGCAGLLLRDRPAVFGVLAAALVFILFNSLLASGTRSVIGRLMSRRKIREVVILITTCLWMLPRVFMQLDIHPKWLGPFADALRGYAYPWSAAASLAQGSFRPILALLAWTLAALWFGRRQFERTLRFDEAAAQARIVTPDSSRRRRWSEAFYRLPSLLWRDPLAAIVEKELRSLARTPRFRMVFVMGFTFGILVWLPMAMGRGGSRFGSAYFLPLVCMYSLTMLGQVTYWNSFGFDRSAAMFYFAAPQPIGRVIAGKNIAAVIFVYLDIAVLAAVVGLFHLGGGWQRVGETFAVIGVSALYLLGLGNIASVNYPRALNPERVNRGGGSGKAQGLLTLFFPLALLPVVLAYVARWALDSEWAFLAVLALAAAIGAAVYWIGVEGATQTGRDVGRTVEGRRSDGGRMSTFSSFAAGGDTLRPIGKVAHGGGDDR